MTDPEIPPQDSYDTSILEVLAGLDPPTPRPRAFTTFVDDASYIAALNDAHTRGPLTADEMAELLAQIGRQDLA
jgi:hypothetical protein